MLQTNISPSFIPIDERYGEYGTREWDKWSVTSNINGEIFVSLSNGCVYQLRLGRLNSPVPSTDGWIPLNSLTDPSLELHAGLAHLPGEIPVAKDGARLGEASFGKISGMDATTDERGRIWVADERANSIRVIVGDKVKTAAGNTDVAVSNNASTAPAKPLHIIDANNTFKEVIIDNSWKSARDGAALGEAVFCRPTSVLYVPSIKSVVITERGRKALRLLNLKTMTVSTIELRMSGPIVDHFRLYSSQLVQYPLGSQIIRILDVKTNTCYNLDLSTGNATLIDKNLVPLCTYVNDNMVTSLWYGKHTNWIQWDLGFSEHDNNDQTLDDVKSIRWIDTPNAAWMYYSQRHNVFISCNPTYKGFNIIPNFLKIRIPNSFPPPFNALSVADPSATSSYAATNPVQPANTMPNQAAAPPTYRAATSSSAMQGPLPPPQPVMLGQAPMGQPPMGYPHQMMHAQPAPQMHPHMAQAPPSMAQAPPQAAPQGHMYPHLAAPAPTHAYPAPVPQQGASSSPAPAQPPPAVQPSQPVKPAQNAPQTVQSKEIAPSSGEPRRWTRRADFSPLFTSPFIGDIHVANTASGHSWNLHSEILMIHSLTDCDAIVKFITETSFPIDSIEAFIGSLYCKRIADRFELRKSCILSSQVMHIWKELGLGNLQFLLVEFATTIVRHLTSDSACESLLDMWSDKLVTWQLEDAPILILTSFVRGTCREQFLSLVTESDLPSKRIIPLVSHISARIDPYPLMAAPYIPSLPELRMTWSKTCEDDDMLDVSYQKNFTLPEEFIKTASDYVFGFDESTDYRHYWLVVPGLYLWPRWTWFRHYVTSSTYETLVPDDDPTVSASQRIIRMPSWVTANILLSIINCMCHAAPPALLSDAEVRLLMENSRELDLVENDGAPVRCFLPLIQHCLERSFPPVSEVNILSHYSRFLKLRMEGKLDELAGLLVKRTFTLDLSKIAAELEMEEINDLFTRIKRLTGVKSASN